MIGRRELVIAVLSASLVGGAAGVVGGALLTRAMLRARAAEAPALAPAPRPHSRGGMMRDLAGRLDLSPEQAARIDSILQRSRLDYAALREQVRAAVERELTPEQLEEWKKMQKRFRRFRSPRRGPERGMAP